MQTDLLILQDQNEVFSTGIKSEKGKGDNISKVSESDDLSEGKDADFLSTLIESLELRAESVEPGAESIEPGVQSSSPEAEGIASELIAQSLELKVEISELKAQSIEHRAEGIEPKAQGPEVKAESLELRAQSLEPGAESSKLKTQNMPSELKAESLGTGALSSELKAESTDTDKAASTDTDKAASTDTDKAARISTIFKETESPRISNQEAKEVLNSKLSAQSSQLKAESPQISDQEAKEVLNSKLSAQSSQLKAESPRISDQEAKEVLNSKLSAQSSQLKAESLGLKAESSELKAQGPELKAESTDTDKAARISTIFKETESSQVPNQEAKEAEGSRLRAQRAEEAESTKLEAESSKLKAESSQAEAQRSTLKAQSLNSNYQDAGEVVKNLIKNQANHEATPKIEGNFQDIKTIIAKNMENFDKNFSHKEPDNVLLFPESRSSDKVSDTGLHAKETQLIQKPLQTEVLTQIVKKAAFNLKNGQTEVKIDLKPEFLGRIQLRISTENHQVMVRMLTEIPLVKEIIENNINHLKADLQNHGLEIDKFNVFLTRDPDQHENGHENAEFLKKNGEPGEGEADGILAEEMEEEAQFEHERAGANLIGVFA